MEPVESYKIFGLLSTIVSTLAALFIMLHGSRDKSKSISLHAAVVKKRSYAMYAFLFILATILFSLFCFYWFIPTFHLPFLFTVLLSIMMILLLLTILIPESGKWIKTHRIVSYGFAFIMALLVFLLLISPAISSGARIISGICLGWMGITWLLFFFASHKRSIAAHYLFFQSSYLIAFFISIVAVTYF